MSASKPKPAHDEVAKKAYAIYLQEGRPQGHAEQNWLEATAQTLAGLREAIRFPGDLYVLFGFASVVFWYGGWPFLTGLFKEIRSRQPGMMTLVAVAITTAYLYSSAVVFGLTGKMFFWELDGWRHGAFDGDRRPRGGPAGCRDR